MAEDTTNDQSRANETWIELAGGGGMLVRRAGSETTEAAPTRGSRADRQLADEAPRPRGAE